jgi:hypothetical protein
MPMAYRLSWQEAQLSPATERMASSPEGVDAAVGADALVGDWLLDGGLGMVVDGTDDGAVGAGVVAAQSPEAALSRTCSRTQSTNTGHAVRAKTPRAINLGLRKTTYYNKVGQRHPLCEAKIAPH